MEIKNRNLKLKMENENENQYSIWDLDLGNQIGEINFQYVNIFGKTNHFLVRVYVR